MGMLACYMEADDVLIEKLKVKSEEDLFDEIERLEEEGNLRIYDLDKMWDGLHFILTGVSADAPVENNLLSEAVVGTAAFSEEDYEKLISYIEPDRVGAILAALNKFDINHALAAFSPQILAQNNIYPAIWVEDDKDILKEELSGAFQELKQFFGVMNNEHKGIIVSIY